MIRLKRLAVSILLAVSLAACAAPSAIPTGTDAPRPTLVSTSTPAPLPSTATESVTAAPTPAATATPFIALPIPKTGEQIAYLVTEINQPARAILVNADGTNATVIAEAAGTEPLALAWNWDGSKLAYIVRNNSNGDLHVRDLVNGGDVLLDNINASSMDWSPDGASLVFSGEANSESGLFVSGADGSGLKRIAERGSQVTWSVRGDIAFIAGDDIYSTDEKGKTPKNLTARVDTARQVRVVNYAWNASGSKIVFAALDATGSGQRIYLINFDGANMDLLSESIQGSGSNDFLPVCSPDTTQIAFYSDRTGAFELYLMRVNGTEVRQLTQSKSYGLTLGQISFNARGNRLAFASTEQHNPGLFVINTDGTGLIQIATTARQTLAGPRWRP